MVLLDEELHTEETVSIVGCCGPGHHFLYPQFLILNIAHELVDTLHLVQRRPTLHERGLDLGKPIDRDNRHERGLDLGKPVDRDNRLERGLDFGKPVDKEKQQT